MGGYKKDIQQYCLDLHNHLGNGAKEGGEKKVSNNCTFMYLKENSGEGAMLARR